MQIYHILDIFINMSANLLFPTDPIFKLLSNKMLRSDYKWYVFAYVVTKYLLLNIPSSIYQGHCCTVHGNHSSFCNNNSVHSTALSLKKHPTYIHQPAQYW